MPYASSETRWFCDDRDILWRVYAHFPPAGEGLHESDRTDYYLRTGLPNTGVKVRQGRHEIKVKSEPDERWDHGIIQHWVKWSAEEQQHILNTIDDGLLEDWIAVEKVRYLKRYRIDVDASIAYAGDQFIDEGCGVEFTVVRVPSAGMEVYTLGFEAFSVSGKCHENLIATLHGLQADYQALDAAESIGYPEFLVRL